jgi:cyclophilin family peptidyl-prolyl cis-trans isomerase
MKYYFLIILFIVGCSRTDKTSKNKFSDNGLIKIYELQDRRNTPALLPFLKAKKEEHRVAAAMAFASIQDTLAIPYLNQMLQIDQDPMPRRAAAFALGQIGHPSALPILKSAFDGELFNDNRRYIIEAIGKCGDSATLTIFENTSYKDSSIRLGWIYGALRLSQKGYYSDQINDRVIQLLSDPYESIATIAGAYARRLVSTNRYEISLDSLVSLTPYPRIRNQFITVNEKPTNQRFNSKWLSVYQTKDIYAKSEMIKQIKDGNVRPFLRRKISTDSTHYSIKNEAFLKFCELYPSDKWDLIIQVLQDSNMALQSLASYQLFNINDEELAFNKQNHLLELCKEAIQKLELPRQAETFIDLNKAISKLSEEEAQPFKAKYNHPIDWEFVKTIPSNQQVIIQTDKGKITLQLFVDHAPGTVSNFLKLINEDYYNNKFIHRVVPQFVIQGGCPRGDGWGSLNWTQRSEFSHYKGFDTGTIGIASAGKDTEGVQFFITHCPTPYLDGRYTAFGRVIQGMNVVQQIQVGDEIKSIKAID